MNNRNFRHILSAIPLTGRRIPRMGGGGKLLIINNLRSKRYFPAILIQSFSNNFINKPTFLFTGRRRQVFLPLSHTSGKTAIPNRLDFSTHVELNEEITCLLLKYNPLAPDIQTQYNTQ
jgi:hypothetical protein